jgi:transposase
LIPRSAHKIARRGIAGHRGAPGGRLSPAVQAVASERLIAGGLATPTLLAHVLISKYRDHISLYRQSQIFALHILALLQLFCTSARTGVRESVQSDP